MSNQVESELIFNYPKHIPMGLPLPQSAARSNDNNAGSIVVVSKKKKRKKKK